MPRYTNTCHVLDKILSIEHRKRGLSLYEDEDFLYLGHNGHVVRVWSARNATIKEVHEQADIFLSSDAIQDAIKCGGISICR